MCKHVRIREPGAPVHSDRFGVLGGRATRKPSPRQPLSLEVCAPRALRSAGGPPRRAEAMGGKKKKQEPPPVEDASWVGEVYERHAERRPAWMNKGGNIWAPAAAYSDQAARTALQHDDEVDHSKSQRTSMANERIAKNMQKAATAYAREVLAAKPVRFDGPRGLKVIDGRPVQVSFVWGWTFQASQLPEESAGSQGPRQKE